MAYPLPDEPPPAIRHAPDQPRPEVLVRSRVPPIGLPALLLATLATAACEVSGSIGVPRHPRPWLPNHPGGGAGINAPAVGLSSDGFGFAVHARDFSSDQTYGPTVYTPGLEVGATLWGYAGGAATLEVRDAGGRIVLTQRLSSNIAQGNAAARGTPPFTVRLTFEHFTGDLSVGVGSGDARP